MFKKIEKIYMPNGTDYLYRITVNNIISDVPLNPANTDYQAIQKWIAEGGEVIDNPPTE
jgi:hypothetical protein